VSSPGHRDSGVRADGIMPVLIKQRASETPEQPFLHDVAGQCLTYGELHVSATRWAEGLERAGVAAGSAVGSMLANCVEHYAIWLGVGWLRALEVPISVELTGEILRHVLASAGVSVLVVRPDMLARLTALEGDLPDLEAVVVLGEGAAIGTDARWRLIGVEEFLRDAPGTTVYEAPRPHDTASVLYTSGTTGPSKGVVMPWAQLRAGCQPTITFATNDGADRFYVCGSPSHVASKGAFATMAITHGELFVRPAFSLSEFWSDIRQFAIRSTVLIGAMADFLLAPEPRPDDADTTLTNVLMVPVTRRVEEFNTRFGTRVWTAYNMTETSSPLAMPTWTVDSRSCGMVRTDYPHYEARLVDEFDNEVPVGDVGELMVRTAVPWTLNSGYLNMPEATAAAWRNGWFHTGDAFRCDEEGLFYFVDRMKDTIRRRGENISSFEVEAAVLRHPQVLECAAVAVPADEVEDEIKIVVVPRPGARLGAQELVDFLTGSVPRYMVPRYVQFAVELPKTQTLRVQKVALRRAGPGDRVWDRDHPSLV
jgi:crotonobetaine/carnitine-CoA ligase